jgi:IS30 family transposase
MGRPLTAVEVRRGALSAFRDGATFVEAAAVVGVSDVSVARWVDKVGGVIPGSYPVVSGRYLSVGEREEIAVWWAAGVSRAEIARRLGRHRSTIGRELTRNRVVARPERWPVREGVSYRASAAQGKAEARARRPKPGKLARTRLLRVRVQAGLRLRWSPQQIAAVLRRRYPDDPEMHVSHETIYQALYVQGRGELRRELTRCLRTGRALRLPHRQADRRRALAKAPKITDLVPISARPAEADDRAVPGHWEGDLILGKNNASAIGTLVERASRYVMLLHLPARHTAADVRDAMIPKIRTLPHQLRRSLTWDQGGEMARHAQITMATDLAVYFCDPHSPWQRGSNENTNGLLRQYFPKSSDLTIHTAADLDAVAAQLNHRPRKTLDWDTPETALARLLSTTTHTGVATTT